MTVTTMSKSHRELLQHQLRRLQHLFLLHHHHLLLLLCQRSLRLLQLRLPHLDHL
jgi:hypothetical protein